MTKTELKDIIKEVIRASRKEKLDESSNSNSANGVTSKGITQKAAVPTVSTVPTQTTVRMGGLKATAKGGSTNTGGETTPYDFNKYLRDNERIKGKMVKP